jgi:hypothetical protein
VLGVVNERIPAIPLEFGIDWAATTFTFGIALAVGVLFGVSPALGPSSSVGSSWPRSPSPSR